MFTRSDCRSRLFTELGAPGPAHDRRHEANWYQLFLRHVTSQPVAETHTNTVILTVHVSYGISSFCERLHHKHPPKHAHMVILTVPRLWPGHKRSSNTIDYLENYSAIIDKMIKSMPLEISCGYVSNNEYFDRVRFPSSRWARLKNAGTLVLRYTQGLR